MRDEKLIKKELERHRSYLKDPKRYCEDPHDKQYFEDVVKVLAWVLGEKPLP